jgi:hypothetical protein
MNEIDERNDEEMIQIMRKVRQFEESWPPSSEEHLQVKAYYFLQTGLIIPTHYKAHTAV